MKEKCKQQQQQQQQKKNNKERQRRNSERVRAKWFCSAFKLGFPQLLCKASLILKSNLESALSINLKQRKLHESKHVAVKCIY